MKTPTPRDWLAALERDPDAHQKLLDREGSLSRAAWLLASIRNQAVGYAKPTPSATDLRSAAAALHSRCGLTEPLPTTEHLAADCRRAGLDVT